MDPVPGPAHDEPSAGVLPIVLVNGRRQPADGPHVSARDRGFTLADGVFETMRAHGGRVFRLARHLARLADAVDALGIPGVPDPEAWVHAAVAAAGAGDRAVRLTVTRGAGPGGVAPPAEVHATVVVTVSAFPRFPSTTYEAGLTARIATGRRNERAQTAGLKTLQYTDAVVALIDAQRAGADEALFLDTDGHCAEASSSNLFAWTGRTLVTPPLACAALPGITRAVVLELASVLGVPAEERAFGVSDLWQAEEAFLTSSLRGLAPLVRVDGRAIGAGRPGALTRQLAAAYTALVSRECGPDAGGIPGRDPRADSP